VPGLRYPMTLPMALEPDGGHDKQMTNTFLRIQTLHLLALIVLTSLVFSNTLDNAYHLDSIYRVQNNTEIDHFWPPDRFFKDPRTGSTSPQIAEYRPMMPLSHAINSEISELTGTSKLAGFHAGNIAIHIASSIVIYFFLITLLTEAGTSVPTPPPVRIRHQAFVASLLFALHPIAGSAVNYIAGRDLLLMVFLFMSAMLIYARMREKGDSLVGWCLTLLLVWLAILSKQTAIVAFGLVFLYEWIIKKYTLLDWRLWLRTLAVSLPTIGYFLLRSLWVTRLNPDDALRVPIDIYFPLTMAKAHVVYYLRNFVWPFEMRALAHFEIVDGVLDPLVIAGLVVIAASLVLALLLRKKWPLLAFGILAYWLLFALEASVFPFTYVVTDYRQYLPSVLLFLLLSIFIFRIKPKWIAYVTFAFLTAYFSISSYAINQHWKTEESFWHQSIRYGGTALAHNNYGLAISSKNPKLAEQHFLIALGQNPNHIYANINLGMHYIRQQRSDEGLAILKRTTDLNDQWALAHYWYAKGLEMAGHEATALDEILEAANLDPRQLHYQYEAAYMLYKEGRNEEALELFDRILSRNPGFKDAGFLVAFIYQKKGDNVAASEHYESYLTHNPGHVQSRFNYAYALMGLERYSDAIVQFEQALDLNPDYREIHLHLSRCYRGVGDLAQAHSHLMLYEGRK
jgi:protein O-mannosyl-transferase